jgi:integrase
MKLTKTAIDKLPAPKDAPALHRDDELKGFGVKVFTSGIKTFFLEKRVGGKVKRITIGRYGELTCEQARRQAVKLAGEIASGGDPVADKARRKLEGTTLRQAVTDYKARRSLKPQTLFDIDRCMTECLADWLDKPLAAITGDMAVKRHREHGRDRSEARANLALRYLRAIFNFAQAEYTTADGEPVIAANPVRKLSQTKSWFRVDRRSTVIKPTEIGAWVNAVLGLPGPDIRDYLQLVVLTGLRRQEALNLAWADVDLSAKTLTARGTKNRRDHTLPLSDYLLDMLTRRKAASASGYVFADNQGRRISNFRYAQAAVEKACGVSFCIHDLRRTYATVAESLDIPAYALKALLNHADGSDVTAGYIIVTAERLRAPMQKITDFVLKAAGIKPTAEIIELPKRGSA